MKCSEKSTRSAVLIGCKFQPMIQNGPPEPAALLASFRMMDSSQLCSLRVRLAGSATRIFSFLTSHSTMKCPDEVKCPADMMATISLPLESASVIRCGSDAVQPETGRPHASAAAGMSA